MPLTPATRLGPYEIVTALGAGGMGEVYRARDTRLGRDVAIKALPLEFSRDAERVARFEREARLLATLSHPNIAGIHGMEEVEGARYLVLEFVEGETLAARLARGPLPLEDALEVCRQVAAGVEAAHEAGVVHRDLKPSNVMLTPSGEVKVLDFGLAKAGAASGSGSHPSLVDSPTVTFAGTEAGVILGTAAYMSPEQARARPVDKRTDIWSFGCLLFECMSGRRLFEGETASDLIAQILRTEPDWSLLPAGLPQAVRALLERCLTKDPRVRLRDIGEARIALASALAGGSSDGTARAPGEGGTPAPGSGPARRVAPVLVAVLAFALVVVSLLAINALRRPAASPLFNASLDLPAGMQLDLENKSLALSPDGRTLVIAGAPEQGRQQLWLRPLDGERMTPLAGTTGAIYPFWSPDGRQVAFFADRKLKKIAVGGGAVQVICDAEEGRGGSWSRDGRIAFAPGPIEGLRIVDASGGESRSLTTLEAPGATHRLPQFLPDGKRLLFLDALTSGGGVVQCLNVDTKERTRVLDGRSDAWYLDPGYLGFVRDGNLMVQRIDSRTLRLSGAPVPLAQEVQFSRFRYTGNYTMAARGPLLYVEGSVVASAQLTWFTLDGTELQRLGEPGRITQAQIAPDGRQVMTAVRDPNLVLWTFDVARGIRTRFTFGPEPSAFPCWTPDGRAMVYGDGTGTVWRKRLDGSGVPEKIISSASTTIWPLQVTPDGREVIVGVQRQSTGLDLWSVPLAGSAEPRKLFETRASESLGAVSPDGRWMAMVSDESGRPEVYVVAYPTLAGRWQVSTDGCLGEGWVQWLPHGRGLVYTKPDRRLAEVELETSGATVNVGTTRTLFGGKSIPDTWTLAPDGTRLLVAVPREGAASTVKLVTDWRAVVARANR